MTKLFPLPVKISSKYPFSHTVKRKFHRFKLSYSNGTYCGNVNYYYELRKLQAYCQSKHLKFEINNNFGKRSTDYRKEFFSHYSPAKRNKYYCSYCGRLVTKDKLTIDHLYPVHIVNKSSYYQAKLMALGATSVNDYRNLVPACRKCNSKKSAKLGLWILRGKLGRCQNIWPLIKFLRFLLILGGIGLIYIFMKENINIFI